MCTPYILIELCTLGSTYERRKEMSPARPIGLSEIANHTGVTVLFPVSKH